MMTMTMKTIRICDANTIKTMTICTGRNKRCTYKYNEYTITVDVQSVDERIPKFGK